MSADGTMDLISYRLAIKLLSPSRLPAKKARLLSIIYFYTITEGMLCAFFTGIGQRKHGERLTMNWNKVPGSKGRCKVYIDKWISNKDGKS